MVLTKLRSDQAQNTGVKTEIEKPFSISFALGLVLIVTNLLVVVVVDDKIDDMSLDLQREEVAEEKEGKMKHEEILTKAGRH